MIGNIVAFRIRIFFLLIIFTKIINLNAFDNEFIKSFVDHYEFNAEGRYAHEYHPALLDKTARSLDELEEELRSRNFNLVGRKIICGYEENAVPSYYTDYTKSKINDEACSKNKVGWSLRLHNRFGFMTGFLFKDLDFFSEKWFNNEDSIFLHIDANDVEIFNDQAQIFQEHAFGKSLTLLNYAQRAILRQFKNGNHKQIFSELIKFWDVMYKGNIKIGNRQIAGTQDILFSIEYANHLLRSELPLFNYFVGPDITYPIELSLSQGKDATIHAQHFVKIFSQKLDVIDNKPTAYIFCSFVDGVGKSTMLGNIKNYLKYGEEVEKYERVDNSSSQLADICQLKENLYIADLPAQVSHFTYKPDGYVYVDVSRELEEDEIKNVGDFVLENKEKFKIVYDQLADYVYGVIKNNGYFADELHNIESPEKAFLRNLYLTKKKKDNVWIPFIYNNKHYLFNNNQPNQIRILIPLAIVQSEGLKSIETEQMLFLKGVIFPLSYDYFLNDFIDKLKNNGIENIVFVDFISMYPRSSRENIRVNYLLQQMALLSENFNYRYSLYRDFVSEAELFAILQRDDSFKKILNSFKLEVLSRLALFKLVLNNEKTELEGLCIKDLTDFIKKESDYFLNSESSFLNDLANKKLLKESKKLKKIYGLTKNFINIQEFSFKKIQHFSKILSDFFVNNIENEHLNVLWEHPGKILSIIDDGNNSPHEDSIVLTENGFRAKKLFDFDVECRDERLLAPFIRFFRSCIYAALYNLHSAQEIESDKFEIKKEHFYAPSVFLDFGIDGKAYLYQLLFNKWPGNLLNSKKIENFFNLRNTQKSHIAIFNQSPYLLDWKSLNTNSKIFAYHYDISVKSVFDKSIITFLVQKYQKEHGRDFVIPTSVLYKNLKDSAMWEHEYKQMLSEAKTREKNKKENKGKENKPQQNNNQNKKKVEEKKKDKKKKKKVIYLGMEHEKPAIRVMLRLIATLDMLLKDPDSNIAIRLGNKKDFKAAIKLLEKVTLPKYFGIIFKENLFDDYEYVEPYPSWDEWDFK